MVYCVATGSQYQVYMKLCLLDMTATSQVACRGSGVIALADSIHGMGDSGT
jgi:hypothetical protein